MKKKRYSILAICALAFTGSCGDFDINGNLDGMWHLRTVETITNDNNTESEDIKKLFIYYSWQQDLINIKRLSKGTEGQNFRQQIGRFNHIGDSLILHSFVRYQNEGIVAEEADLIPFYLDGKTSRYAIQELNAKKMVLRSKHRELTFKKF